MSLVRAGSHILHLDNRRRKLGLLMVLTFIALM